MAEQRYQAVLAVIQDGLSVTEVVAKVGVPRQTVHAWLSRYAGAGVVGLEDRSQAGQVPRNTETSSGVWSRIERQSPLFNCALSSTAHNSTD